MLVSVVCVLALVEAIFGRGHYRLYLPYLVVYVSAGLSTNPTIPLASMDQVQFTVMVFNLYALSPTYYARKWTTVAEWAHWTVPKIPHELLRDC